MDVKTKILLAVFTIVFICGTMFFCIMQKSKINSNGEHVYSRGSRGEAVEQIQTWINGNTSGIEPVTVDGIFGEQTEKALFALTGKKKIALSELK